MAEERKEGKLRWSKFLCGVDGYLQRACWPLRGSGQALLWKGQWSKRVFCSFWRTKWYAITLILISATESMQLPLCSPFPGPLSVLIMDNTCIHHGDRIIELLECYGMSWFYVINHWLYGVRSMSCISSTLLTRSQSNWGGVLKDQSMDLTQQWHFLSSNRRRPHVRYARGSECNHRIRCYWVLCTCRLFVALLPYIFVSAHTWMKFYKRAEQKKTSEEMNTEWQQMQSNEQ